MKWFLLVAILLGASAFMLDAFFAHGLRSYLGESYSETAHNALSTAARYQLNAALFLLVLVIFYRNIPSGWVVISQFLVLLGVIFFCASIYLKHILGFASLAIFAPIGGISFMLAFVALIPLMMAL